ncbi:MAG: cysteine--tRNA ligase, partial [Lachnospiraceae bacterium]|nr:cysteine--tRNA ligase [Lachnospiraceae bacterium]
LQRIETAVSNIKFKIDNQEDAPISEEETKLLEEEDAFRREFEQAMEDDANTADAISAVFNLVRFANSNTEGRSSEFLKQTLKNIETLLEVLGLRLSKEEELLDEEVEALIEERNQARKNRDFARADEIRDSLLAQGILLEDTREGVRWKRA